MTDIYYIPIHLEIVPGSVPAEEVVALLLDVSRLYRLCGGSGLSFKPLPLFPEEGHP